MSAVTPKQRMLNAYRGQTSDSIPVAPEFWYYYPAKVLGVDMIEFQRDVPFHSALKTTFEMFECEGWGAAGANIPNDNSTSRTHDRWLDNNTLEVTTVTKTAEGELASVQRYDKQEPSWVIERQVKDLNRDLAAWEIAALGGDPGKADVTNMVDAWREVGESYLLEANLGTPFFDFFAAGREGGFEASIYDFLDPDLESTLIALQEKYIDHVTALARTICQKTPFESLFMGCSWSCNSLLGPDLWRRWDKPVIRAVAEEIHRHNKLLHIHFHGNCMDTVADFAELDIDCVCPFERPPGGDIEGAGDLGKVSEMLMGKTTMNGNVHTVETLIRGNEQKVREEVREIIDAFGDNPRLIIGTGDQVGRETPEENLRALVDEVRQRSQ